MLWLIILFVAGLVLLAVGLFFTVLFGIIWISEWLGGEIPTEQYWMVVAAALIITALAGKFTGSVKRD